MFYRLVKTTFNGQPLNILKDVDRYQIGVFIPMVQYVETMGFTPEEHGPLLGPIVSHAVTGLARRELIDQSYATGPVEAIKKVRPGGEQPGLVLKPSPFGAEVFLWVHGHPNVSVSDLLSPEVVCVDHIGTGIPASHHHGGPMAIDVRRPLKKFLPHLVQAQDEALNEADTVQRIITVFADVFGYDRITDTSGLYRMNRLRHEARRSARPRTGCAANSEEMFATVAGP